jgi:hypothetical protein
VSDSLLAGALVAVALSACGSVASTAPRTASQSATALPAATASPSPRSVTVTLYHCGIDPLKYNGQTWEVPNPPFDATNRPQTWRGTGKVIALTTEHLRFRDDSGIVVEFVPDDGKPPPICY